MEIICNKGAAETIREILKIEDLNQRKLANKMGVTRQNVSDFLNRGTKSMRYDSFERMISALGYEIIVRKKLEKQK